MEAHQTMLCFGSVSPQRFPQYLEVPPNIEGKQIVSTFSTLPSYQYNPALSKDDSSPCLSLGWWQAICEYVFHDPGHHPNEGSC